MEAGEREMRKAFEEVTTRNVKANIEFTTNTRDIVRELENKIASLEESMRQYDDKLKLLSVQLSTVQSKVYGGGTA